MRIAINTRFLLPHKMEGFGWYTYEITKRLVENHPEHEFYLFFDRPFDPKFVFRSNCKPIVVFPPARHPILFYIWFEWSIQRALKKHKIDVFFSPDGHLSLRSEVKQIGVMHDINFEHYPEDLPKTALAYYKRNFPKFARKADHIITVSEYSKQDISHTYQIDSSKITAIWNGASTQFEPIDEEEKNKVKAALTSNKEYFLFVGALHPRKNLKRLLQAFEAFKMQTKSKTKLVIVGEKMWDNPKFNQSLQNDLSSEIVFTGHLKLEALTRIMAAAKALAFIPYFEGFGIPIIEAMRCGTPVLSGNLTSLPEIAGEAALYCDPFNIEDITMQLTRMDTDEALRKELSTKGLARSKEFSWDQAATQVARILQL